MFGGRKITKKYSLNTKGKDYVVGDIHGEFKQLEKKLDLIGFNENTDRLYSLGDLTDRGQHSKDVFEWMNKKWFYPIRGNHEELLISVNKSIFTEAAVVYYRNGGEWYFDLTKKEQKKVAKYYKSLPTAITVETNFGPVGLIHADCPVETWSFLNKLLNSSQSIDIERKCIWSRQRLHIHDQIIPDVRAIIIGHMKQDAMTQHGNFYLIDTGSGYENGHLTILDLETLKAV